MLLIWTDNLSVGVKKFDCDHRNLIRTINELHCVILRSTQCQHLPEEEIEIAIHRLENYFRQHCQMEEAAMAETKFPGLEEHKLAHLSFLNHVAEMSVRFRGSTDPKDGEELMTFIFDWVSNHIFTMDKLYSSHLHLHGIF